MKSELLKLRKTIYKYLKDKALSFETTSVEISNYQSNQERFAQRKFQSTDMNNLLASVRTSDVIYIGDFHTFDQNIRNVLRIIKVLIEQESQPILGLEMVDAKFQLILDTYMEGQLTELEFLEEVNYHDSWRFPWTHYKLIFELAKENGIRIVGLNTEGSMHERDEFASTLINETVQENDSGKMIVLYGEYHIARNKIPALTTQKSPSLTQTIIHQNLDDVYWRLQDENSSSEVVKFNEEEYCLITAPPWIKYESMTYWYENLCDDPEFDIHNYIIENGKKIFSDDTKENFFHICFQIINYLNLEIEEDELEDYNLYDHTNLEFVEEVLSNSLDRKQIDFYNYLIGTNKSFRFLDNKFYCSSYSMNRISYLAGIHILHFYLQKKNINSLTISNESDKLFSLMTLEAIMAYYFSKVINPHRKCELYLDFREKNHFESPILEQANALTNTLLDNQEIEFQDIKSASFEVLYESALDIGHLLGEYLYILSSQSKSPEHLIMVLNELDLDLNYLSQLKNSLLKNFQFKTHQKRYF